MTEVNIKIWAKPTTDTYARIFGFVIDGTLPADFHQWTDEQKLKHPATGEPFAIGAEFTLTVKRDIPTGSHTVVFAPTSPAGYFWEAEIFINDNSLGRQTNLCASNPYYAEFQLKPTPSEVMAATMGSLISMIIPLLMIPMLLSIVKGLKRRT